MAYKFVTVKGASSLATAPFYIGIPQHERIMPRRETYKHLEDRTGYKATARNEKFAAVIAAKSGLPAIQYLKVVPPVLPPVIGEIRTESTEDGTVKVGEDVVITGANLAGATVKIKYKTPPEEERQTYVCPAVVAEDGKITIAYENWRFVPDDLEGGTTIEFIVETAGGSASRDGIEVNFDPPAPTLSHARSPECDDMVVNMNEDVILTGTNLNGFERLVAHHEECADPIELPTEGVYAEVDGTELDLPGSIWVAIKAKVDPGVMPTRPITFEVITPGGSASISPTVP